MMPKPRLGDVFPLPPNLKPREAGVLILLYPGADDLCFFLTRRTESVEMHKGQISLPGGMQEPGESLHETALRETREELGIETNGIQILGEPLSPVYIPVSNFRLTPFVAFTPERPAVHPALDEVTEVIETSLQYITDETNTVEEDWEIRGLPARVPFFAINGHKVWGATAMVLGELGEMLRQIKR
jgi:8-oxo-dGTP pyrophosphatase MutT (NUDIX family)